jgi:hypothetical protein
MIERIEQCECGKTARLIDGATGYMVVCDACGNAVEADSISGAVAKWSKDQCASTSAIDIINMLNEELAYRLSQTLCDCGHPQCARCHDDRGTEDALVIAANYIKHEGEE